MLNKIQFEDNCVSTAKKKQHQKSKEKAERGQLKHRRRMKRLFG